VLEALKDGVAAIYPKISRPACFFILSSAIMSLKPENGDLAEKHANAVPGYEPTRDGHFSSDPENMVVANENMLHQDLKGRHMQMIAMQVQHSEPSSVY
jgi:amino acid permease